MANEIKLRFSASSLQQILADLEKTGNTGDAAFLKIANAIDKPNKALLLGQHEIEKYRQAMVAAGDTSTRTFARIDQLARQGNPWLLGLDKASAQAGAAVEGLAARAGTGGAVLAAMGPGGLAAAAGIGVATVAVGKLTEAIHEYGQEAEDLQRTAKAVGTTTDALQEFRHVGDAVSVSNASMDASLLGINQALGAVKVGGRGAAMALEAFKALGFTREQLQGYTDAGQMIPKIADGVRQLDDASAARVLERLHVPTDAIASFKQSSDEIARLRQEAHNLGLVLDNETVKSLASSNQELREANHIIGNQLAGAFAPLDAALARSMMQFSWSTNQIFGWIAAAARLPGVLAQAVAGIGRSGSNGPVGISLPAGGLPWPLGGGRAATPKKSLVTPEQEKGLEDLKTKVAELVVQDSHLVAVQKQLTEATDHGSQAEKDYVKIHGEALLAAARAQDAAAAASKARAAGAPGRKAAQDQAQAEQQLDALRAKFIDHTVQATQVEAVLTQAIKAGGKARADALAIGQQLRDAAQGKDAADELRRTEKQTAAQLEWNAAISGYARDSRFVVAAENSIAAAYEAGLKPTEAQIVAVRALGAARQAAADAARSLQAASPFIGEARDNVTAGLPDTAMASGRFDPGAALRQWQGARAQILAEGRRLIAEDEARALADGTKTKVDAEHDAQEAIRGLDLAYATLNVQTVADIQRQAVRERVAMEMRATDDLKRAMLQGGDDIVSALRQFEGDGNWGDLGKNIGKAVMGGLLDALVNDPIRNMIHDAIDSLFASSGSGSGGLLGSLLRLGGSVLGGSVGIQPMGLALSGGISGPANMTAGLNTSLPSLPGFASGMRGFGGGLAKVHGDEVLWLPDGADVYTSRQSRELTRALADGGGARRAQGGGATVIHGPVTVNNFGSEPLHPTVSQGAGGTVIDLHPILKQGLVGAGADGTLMKGLRRTPPPLRRG